MAVETVQSGNELETRELIDDTRATDRIDDGPDDSLLAEGWSHLRYVGVEIDCLDGNVTAPSDSGCQLFVVRRDAA